jgi:hypothetical protein
MVLLTFKRVNSENHNSQGANSNLNDEGFKRWSERKVLYFVDIYSIGFISDELAKIQLRFKEEGISDFYPQYSLMSLKNKKILAKILLKFNCCSIINMALAFSSSHPERQRVDAPDEARQPALSGVRCQKR